MTVQTTLGEMLGAYQSYFALQNASYETARPPGYRRKNSDSGLRHYDGDRDILNGSQLTLSLGLSRLDGVRQVTVQIQNRTDVVFRKLFYVLLTYDTAHGMETHVVVDGEDALAKGMRKVAVDLGETQAISAMFDDRTDLLYSGREIKAIRRYWQKVRAKVKPPTAENRKKSRRYRQIERKETRQVNHLLHLISKDFVECCKKVGVDTIVIGKLAGVCEKIDYGDHLNQRLRTWPFVKRTHIITDKLKRYGIQVVAMDEAYTSQTSYCCHKVAKSNRTTRGSYDCTCGWYTHADIKTSAFHISPLKGSSGDAAFTAVVSLIAQRHTV